MKSNLSLISVDGKLYLTAFNEPFWTVEVLEQSILTV